MLKRFEVVLSYMWKVMGLHLFNEFLETKSNFTITW